MAGADLTNNEPSNQEQPAASAPAATPYDKVLEQVRQVAKRIAERVEKVTGDTDETLALPTDSTETQPPLK